MLFNAEPPVRHYFVDYAILWVVLFVLVLSKVFVQNIYAVCYFFYTHVINIGKEGKVYFIKKRLQLYTKYVLGVR